MRFAALLLPPLLACACGREPAATPDPARQERLREAADLAERLEEPGALDRIVELGELGPVLDATGAASPPRIRRLACLALGRIGGERARDRLIEMLEESTKDPSRDGPTHLYAAAGLTLLNDPGTAIDLVLNLSQVNPNDSIAVLASEERTEEYYPIDAQICDALLSMGLWRIEEELVEQLRRRDRIRVLIDAYAVLRRHTGLDLPFRYNGSYADREADADRWLERLRATRAERERGRPFEVSNPRFRTRCRDIVAWLGGQTANLQLIARKLFVRVGEPGIPFLVEALESPNVTAQRRAAQLLGRIGLPSAAPPLCDALDRKDPDVRAKSLRALEAIGDRGGLSRAVELLEDRDTGVRTAAAKYLGALGNDGHRAPLRRALGKETASVARTALLCALLRLGDSEVGPRVIEVFLEGQQHEREAALGALREASGLWEGTSALAPRKEREKVAAVMRRWFEER